MATVGRSATRFLATERGTGRSAAFDSCTANHFTVSYPSVLSIKSMTYVHNEDYANNDPHRDGVHL
jgi:hypothetical protein